MNALTTRRFALWATSIALAAGALTGIVAATHGLLTLGFGLGGWLSTALIGVGGGIWMSRNYGTPGSGFLVALGTCMLARLAVAAVGVILAAIWLPEAFWPVILGVAAGYLPLQVFESIWFSLRARTDRRDTESSAGSLAQRSSEA